MTSEAQNFEMYAGEDKILTVTVTDAAGDVVDLTDASIEWVMKRTADDTTALVTKTLADGITCASPATGVFTVTLEAADTEELGGASYLHEAEVTDAGDNVSTVTRGVVTIKKSLT